MKNSFILDKMKSEFNEEKNYETILSNIRKEKCMKRKILNMVAIFLVVILIGIGSNSIYAKVKWEINFKEYVNDIGFGRGVIKEAYEVGMNANLEMQSIYQDGIRVKPYSILITDDHIELGIEFEIDDGIILDSETFSSGIAIYDDNNELYYYADRYYPHSGRGTDYWKYLAKELGINKKDFWNIQYLDSGNYGIESVENKTIKMIFEMDTNKTLPKSEKIFVRIFDIGFFKMDFDIEDSDERIRCVENFELSDKSFNFEIDVPQKFMNRNTKNVVLKDEIDGVEIKIGTVNETGMNLKIKLSGIGNFISEGRFMAGNDFSEGLKKLLYISDEDGNKYYDFGFETAEEEDVIKVRYDLNSKSFDKKIYLNVMIDGINYQSELLIK